MDNQGNKKKVVPMLAWTAEDIDKAVAGKVPVSVGINGGRDGSRRVIKGKTDRQPMIRGCQAVSFK